ncbi:hypothetical protein O6H91_07G125000 [Diphasiastrum complanatum]|uniref:Uncharacterized protein n=1 Tax=Diphasiastrum complanatum TaxID=34168 RepID=A0ACC2D9C9_DIPCM|nr:hypothetical protein O6H91_07G125000 [Diphasiastrum complanatum]
MTLRRRVLGKCDLCCFSDKGHQAKHVVPLYFCCDSAPPFTTRHLVKHAIFILKLFWQQHLGAPLSLSPPLGWRWHKKTKKVPAPPFPIYLPKNFRSSSACFSRLTIAQKEHFVTVLEEFCTFVDLKEAFKSVMGREGLRKPITGRPDIHLINQSNSCYLWGYHYRNRLQKTVVFTSVIGGSRARLTTQRITINVDAKKELISHDGVPAISHAFSLQDDNLCLNILQLITNMGEHPVSRTDLQAVHYLLNGIIKNSPSAIMKRCAKRAIRQLLFKHLPFT